MYYHLDDDLIMTVFSIDLHVWYTLQTGYHHAKD